MKISELSIAASSFCRFRNSLIFSVLFCICGVLFPPHVSGQDFTILDFRADILVSTDSSFTVRETITVEFHRSRHGIYREIPFVYTDSLGKKITTPTKVFSVRDGKGNMLRNKITFDGNAMNIRIGDPDAFVSGRQIYEIFYRVENAILFLDSHDEIYWNLTGNEWKAEIKNAEGSISLGGNKTNEVLAACYMGNPGSTERSCSYTASDNFIEFRANRSLSPGEGFTIAFGWDKGIVAPPSSFKQFIWLINLKQNWIFIIPFLSLVLMILLWHGKGRDPKVRESVAVMYGPPKYNDKPLCPAEVGTLMDETLDPRDITATIVGLAVKGFIKIEERKEEGIIFDSKDYYLSKQKEPDEKELSLFEKKLMSALFGGMPGVMVGDLKNKFYTHIDSLRHTIYSELTNKKFFTVSPDRVRQFYTGAALVTGLTATILLNMLFSDSTGDTRALLAGALSGLPVFAFARFMPAKTRYGSSAYMHTLGFEEFLTRAEKDQLIRMKDENLFSKFFPYALALNVADNWAKAFEGIYQQPPDWYVSPAGMRTFSPRSFNRSFSSAMSNLSTAMYSAPRGSGTGSGGSSGGGFSGGGFGGGGGGSW
jgi:uncharacterized membrane protein YgcG